jgi:hypothetical protein
MVFGDVTTEYLDLISLTDFSDEVTDSYSYATSEHRLMVLRRPDQVVFAVEDSMTGFSIEFHPLTVSS